MKRGARTRADHFANLVSARDRTEGRIAELRAEIDRLRAKQGRRDSLIDFLAAKVRR